MSDSATASATFSCPQCSKSYPWSAQLAGKKGKCKCGAIMAIPVRVRGEGRSAVTVSASSSRLGANSFIASRPPPRPQPVPTPAAFIEEADDQADSAHVASVQQASEASRNRSLKWLTSLKWLGRQPG